MHYCLTDFVLELVHNAIDARAKKIVLTVIENTAFSIIVADDGVGMTPVQAQQALDPFYTAEGKHTKRRVGLGLPFVKQITEITGGSFLLESTLGLGTTVKFTVPLNHIDCPPLGSLIEGFVSIVAYAQPETDIVVIREKNNKQYVLVKTEIIEALGGAQTAGEQKLLCDYIQSQEDSL